MRSHCSTLKRSLWHAFYAVTTVRLLLILMMCCIIIVITIYIINFALCLISSLTCIHGRNQIDGFRNKKVKELFGLVE